MKSETIIKPAERRKSLRARVDAFIPLLPDSWVILFIHDHREYRGQEILLRNVRTKTSLDERTIEKIEAWVKTL